MAAAKHSQPTFEQAIERLEAIIDRVESGEIGLEESLQAYEQGDKLIKQCRQILARVEKRIAELVVDAEGRLKPAGDADAPDAEHSALEGEIDEEVL